MDVDVTARWTPQAAQTRLPAPQGRCAGFAKDRTSSTIAVQFGRQAMNPIERIYRIDQLINQRGIVSFDTLMRELEVSRATLKRDLAWLRDRLNAPMVYDRERGGYRYGAQQAGPQYALPGLWFNEREVLALLTMHRMLQDLDQGGLLGAHIGPLAERLDALLSASNATAADIRRRVRIMNALSRPVSPQCFEVVGQALLERKRLSVMYFTRSRNSRSLRELSPQRLVHYRNAWYLDAWCHRSDALRVFALDAIDHVSALPVAAHDVDLEIVERELGEGYGIYRGGNLHWAVLQFTPEAARWVRSEIWHPRQQGRTLPDEGYELRVPYSNPAELEMDILRHGEAVSVLGPQTLRDRIARRLQQAALQYERNAQTPGLAETNRPEN